MKNFIKLLPLLLMVSSSGRTQKPYEINSAKVDYVFSNGFQSGTKTMIFTDYGKTEKLLTGTQTDTSRFNHIAEGFSVDQPTSRILTIQTADSVFTVDIEKMIGSKRLRINIDMASMFDDQKKKIGTDTFLNRVCDVVNFAGFKIWYWKGLSLKKEMVIEGDHKVYEYAVSIDENYSIKADEFKVPDNVKFQ